jgi:hypothetical protein
MEIYFQHPFDLTENVCFSTPGKIILSDVKKNGLPLFVKYMDHPKEISE